MRHQVAGYRLDRSKDARARPAPDFDQPVVYHERIETTRAKAMAMRGDAERLITLARNSAKGTDTDKVNARRLAAARLNNPEMVKKLFDDIAPRFASRPGGYTRMLKLGPRLGDAADMVLIELVEE